MRQRFGDKSVLDLGNETPAADASIQSQEQPTMPGVMPGADTGVEGSIGEQKSNSQLIIEALANVIKKIQG